MVEGRSGTGRAESLALSVHGPSGVVDLVVPSGASAADVAGEYAAQAGTATVTSLRTTLGVSLHPGVPLADAGVVAGAVLVADGGHQPPVATAPRPPRDARSTSGEAGRLSALWFSVAAAAALLAGWFAARDDSDLHATAIWTLAVSAALALVPVGRFVRHRLVTAPVFAFAAAYAAAWAPEPERLPTVIGLAALTAAVVAAVARALTREAQEALRIWMVAGVACFVLTTGAALAGAAPQVVWATLLVLAMLAARFVPGLAVDVPDQFLIDIERLAVTAWSARDRRGRTAGSNRGAETGGPCRR